MTPAALTPAAKRKAAAKRKESSHPRQVRRGAAPSSPRRLSGPIGRTKGSPAAARALLPPPPVAAPRAPADPSPGAGPRARATGAPAARPNAARPRATAAPAARPTAPRARNATTPRARTTAAPRRRAARATTRARGVLASFSLPAIRIALPSLPLPHARPARAPAPPLPIGQRALAFVRGLPDHPMLDRLVRGRAWIPFLGVMLAGIVFMQVEELKIGAAFGRAVQQTAVLSTQNQSLLASTGALADTSRIESIATRLGYVMPAPSQTGFLAGWGDHLAAALANLRAPDPNLYLNAASTTNGGIAGTPVSTPSYALGTPATTSTSTSTAGGTTSTAGATTAGTTTAGTTTATTGTPATTTSGSPGTTTTPPAATGQQTTTGQTTNSGGAQLPAAGNGTAGG
jgi:hypothetical protein